MESPIGASIMFCEVEGVNIYFEAIGEGYPILMLHGYGIDHHVMTGCMEPLFRDRPGYRRIYVDLPGMGRSKAPEWLESTDQVLDRMVDDVIQKFFLDQTKHVDIGFITKKALDVSVAGTRAACHAVMNKVVKDFSDAQLKDFMQHYGQTLKYR